MGTGTVTVFVCVTCGAQDGTTPTAGRLLFQAVAARVPHDGAITVTPIACLAVCKRPCTVALAGTGKWTSVVGGLDHTAHADDVVAAAASHAATDDGIIPWRERPLPFRKGVVARIPPPGFRHEDPEV
jgi:predicted metal-binding protein